jgi:regulatory protein
MLALVQNSPRKIHTEPELYAAALRALTRRAHSIYEMRGYLARRAEDQEAISAVIARLREHRYLDDARYALDYARQHAQGRRQGRFRIARELRGRGVPDTHIDAALQTIFAETDEAAMVRARLKRRLTHIRGSLSQNQIASLYRSLLRSGFAADTIRAELHAVKGNLPETPDEALDAATES